MRQSNRCPVVTKYLSTVYLIGTYVGHVVVVIVTKFLFGAVVCVVSPRRYFYTSQPPLATRYQYMWERHVKLVARVYVVVDTYIHLVLVAGYWACEWSWDEQIGRETEAVHR